MLSPLPQYKLIQTAGSDSFKKMGAWETGLPLFGHCGSFGFRRKFHFHEGLDFYVPERTSVYACEPGEVLAITAFTGQHANCPWWAETWGVLVESCCRVTQKNTASLILRTDGEHISTLFRLLKNICRHAKRTQKRKCTFQDKNFKRASQITSD